LFDAEFRGVAEERFRLVDAGETVRDVARAVRTVFRLDFADLRIEFAQIVSEIGEQFVQRGAFAERDIVDLIDGFRLVRQQRQLIGLNHIVYVREIAAVGAITVDDRAFVLHQAHDELRNHGRVGAIRILAASEDIEIPQSYGVNPVEVMEVARDKLVDVFRDCIRGKRFADLVFHLRKRFAVAISGAAGGIDEAFDFRLLRRVQHIDESEDVHGGGGHRVLDRTGNAAQRRFVQDILDAVHGLAAIVHVANVANDQLELFVADKRDEINHFARGKIVKDSNLVVLSKQGFNEVGPDKTGAAGNQNFRIGNNLHFDKFSNMRDKV